MSPVLSAPSGNLAEKIKGIWWLLSRTDWTENSQLSIDPILGKNPIGMLSYSATHFSAQFSKRDRSVEAFPPAPTAGNNNTASIEGYDAYFGTYQVDETTGVVAHTLIASVVQSNVGVTVYRDLRVDNNMLTIQLATTNTAGTPIVRTLIWVRMG